MFDSDLLQVLLDVTHRLASEVLNFIISVIKLS